MWDCARVDDQANALGLPRSSAWTILKTCHKSYGLSAAVIERMLRSSKLSPRARAILVEYVEEKSFGLYGGSRRQQQRFAIRLSNTIASWSGPHCWALPKRLGVRLSDRGAA